MTRRKRGDDTLLCDMDPLELMDFMEGEYKPKKEQSVNKRVKRMHDDLKAKERAMKKQDEE